MRFSEIILNNIDGLTIEECQSIVEASQRRIKEFDSKIIEMRTGGARLVEVFQYMKKESPNLGLLEMKQYLQKLGLS